MAILFDSLTLSSDDRKLGYNSRACERLVLYDDVLAIPCQRNNLWWDSFGFSQSMGVLDICLHGIGLSGSLPFRPGDKWLVTSPSGDQRVCAYVIWGQPDRNMPRSYRGGLAWDELPSLALFMQWESYLYSQQLPAFHEQVAVLDVLLPRHNVRRRKLL